MVRRVGAGVAALLLSWSLLACTGEKDPKPKFSKDAASSSAASSPSESDATGSSEPVEPTPPPEMEGSDKAAAEAFVRYYYETLSYAIASGDVRELSSMSIETCKSCASVERGVNDVHSHRNVVVRGGEFSADNIVVEARGNLPGGARSYGCLADVSVSEQRITGTGNPKWDGVSKPETGKFQIQVFHSSRQGWVMGEWRPQ